MTKRNFSVFQKLAETIPHMCGPSQGKWVWDLIQSNLEGDILEVGAYYGYMTAIMAQAALGSQKRVYSVDHMIGGICDFAEGEKCVYRDYVDNLITLGVWRSVIPFPMKSKVAIEMFQILKPQFGLVYLDGDHNEEPVFEELTELEQFVLPGGMVCGDDCLSADEPKPFTEIWNRNDIGEFYYQGVSQAVWKFFRGNPRFEVLPSVPPNQFGFRKIR